MATFEFQEALTSKGIKQKDLPDNLKEQIKNLENYARQFNGDLSEEEEDKLLEKIDYVDSQIAKAINELELSEDKTVIQKKNQNTNKEDSEDKTTEESKGGSGVGFLIFTAVAGLITWAIVKKN